MSIVQNDISPILFKMTLASDATGRTPAPGLVPVVTLSKAGGAFAAATGAVAELTNGWYKLTPLAADTGTLGDLGIRATAATADTWEDQRRVVQAGPLAADYTSVRAAKLDNADASVAAVKAKTDALPPDPADQSLIIAATDALNTAIGNVPANVRTNLATELARIDVTIGSRALATGATLTSGERTEVAAAILATIIETNGQATLSVKQTFQLVAALVGGKIAGIVAGTGAQTFTVRSATDLQTIASVTGDEIGNRTGVVLTIP